MVSRSTLAILAVGDARDCTDAMDVELSNQDRAVLRYQDDLTNTMKGRIVVQDDVD
jgi:hypothetical protein